MKTGPKFTRETKLTETVISELALSAKNFLILEYNIIYKGIRIF
jgi:hypothetical protein